MHAPDTKAEKMAQRLSGILARLHQGEALDKHQLVKEFGVDVRTIERDMVHRLNGIAERNADGYWQLANASRGAVPSSRLHDFARLTGNENFFPDTSLRYLLSQLETPEQRRAIRVQPTPQVDLSAKEPYFAQLQGAIEHRRVCTFTYSDKRREAQPYSLIHKNGVWYLAAEEGGRLKNFSVAKIEDLAVDPERRFEPKPAHFEYIQSHSDVWFTPETTTVRLRVSSAMAHYFTRRPLLPNQSQEQDADGSLLVTAQINHINQLLPIVRYWLPHVRIVQPVAWHEELLAEIGHALALWGVQAAPSTIQHHRAPAADRSPAQPNTD